MGSGSLTAERKREVIQLMLVAESYLLLAEKLGAASLSKNQNEIMHWFDEGKNPTVDQMKVLQ